MIFVLLQIISTFVLVLGLLTTSYCCYEYIGKYDKEVIISQIPGIRRYEGMV